MSDEFFEHKAYSVGITVSLDPQGRASWRVAAYSAVDDERFIEISATLEEAVWRVSRAIEARYPVRQED